MWRTDNGVSVKQNCPISRGHERLHHLKEQSFQGKVYSDEPTFERKKHMNGISSTSRENERMMGKHAFDI